MITEEIVHLTEREEEDVKIVSVKGSVLSENVYEFKEKLSTYLSTKKMVLDLKELEFISSAGVGVLLSFVNEMMKNGNDIVFAEIRQAVMKVFKVVGLDAVFMIYPTVDSAVDYLIIKDL